MTESKMPPYPWGREIHCSNCEKLIQRLGEDKAFRGIVIPERRLFSEGGSERLRSQFKDCKDDMPWHIDIGKKGVGIVGKHCFCNGMCCEDWVKRLQDAQKDKGE